MGTMQPSSRTQPDKGVGSDASLALQKQLVEAARDSFERHVLRPNPNVRVDAFIHSWNPSLGPTIDRLYQPIDSAHEIERFGRDPYVVSQSALASIKWTIDAKQRHEQSSKRSKAYDIAMLMRHDLAFHTALRWHDLPRGQLWGVAECCPWRNSPVGLPSLPKGVDAARRIANEACLGGHNGEASRQGEVMDYCRVSKVKNWVRLHAEEAELNNYINDWLLIAPSSTLDTFRHLSTDYNAYAAALGELGLKTTWLHFLWSLHIHDALGLKEASGGLQSVRVQVSLVRNARLEGCYVNTTVALPPPPETLWAGSARLCPMRGMVRCHYHSLRCALLRDSPASFL